MIVENVGLRDEVVDSGEIVGAVDDREVPSELGDRAVDGIDWVGEVSERIMLDDETEDRVPDGNATLDGDEVLRELNVNDVGDKVDVTEGSDTLVDDGGVPSNVEDNDVEANVEASEGSDVVVDEKVKLPALGVTVFEGSDNDVDNTKTPEEDNAVIVGLTKVD